MISMIVVDGSIRDYQSLICAKIQQDAVIN